LFQIDLMYFYCLMKYLHFNFPTDMPSTVTSRSTLKQNTTSWRLMVMKVMLVTLWTTPGMAVTTVRSQRTTGVFSYSATFIHDWYCLLISWAGSHIWESRHIYTALNRLFANLSKKIKVFCLHFLTPYSHILNTGNSTFLAMKSDEVV
jgi:hypothetical protein